MLFDFPFDILLGDSAFKGPFAENLLGAPPQHNDLSGGVGPRPLGRVSPRPAPTNTNRGTQYRSPLREIADTFRNMVVSSAVAHDMWQRKGKFKSLCPTQEIKVFYQEG
jgi:hypothetical protein